MSTLRDAVAKATERTPYSVVDTKKGFDVQLDVTNQQWWGVFTRLRWSYQWRVAEKPAHFSITDRKVRTISPGGVPRLDIRTWRDLMKFNWDGGGLGISFSWSVRSGRLPSFSRTNIWAVSPGGNIEPVADYRFNSREGRDLIRLVAQQQGLTEHQPWAVKGPLIAALITPAFFAAYGLFQLLLRLLG